MWNLKSNEWTYNTLNIEIHGSVLHFEWIFYPTWRFKHHAFIGHLDNDSSLSSINLPNVDTFCYKQCQNTCQNNHYVKIIIKIPTQKSLQLTSTKLWSIRKLSSSSDRYILSKILIFTRKPNSIIGNNHCQVFSLKWQAHFIRFQRKCLSNMQSWKTSQFK